MMWLIAAVLLPVCTPDAMAQQKGNTPRHTRRENAKPQGPPSAEEAASIAGVTLKGAAQGVRFVVCSASGTRLTSPLYTKLRNEYIPLTITSRMPSIRIAATSGVVRFYDKEPADAKDEKNLTPYIEIQVPKEYSTKSVCILVPDTKGKVDKAFFLKEDEFTVGSAYVINMTNTPLEMITSTTGDFNGEEVKRVIAPGVHVNRIEKGGANVWAFKHKKEKADADGRIKKLIYFQLRTKSGDPQQSFAIKTSTFMPKLDVAEVNIVTDNPRHKGSFSLLSFQFKKSSDASAE